MMQALRVLLERIDDATTTVLFAVGLVVSFFVAALMLASATALPTGHLLADIGLWTAALLLTGRLVILLAVRLRAQAFGAAPPRTPVSTQDLLAYAVSMLMGPMLLIWFAPRIMELRPAGWRELIVELQLRWVDLALIAAGLFCVAWPVWAFLRYISRR